MQIGFIVSYLRGRIEELYLEILIFCCIRLLYSLLSPNMIWMDWFMSHSQKRLQWYILVLLLNYNIARIWFFIFDNDIKFVCRNVWRNKKDVPKFWSFFYTWPFKILVTHFTIKINILVLMYLLTGKTLFNY